MAAVGDLSQAEKIADKFTPWILTGVSSGFSRRSVGEGPLRRQNLARAEPLTALPRSARSRVSLSPNRCLLRRTPSDSPSVHYSSDGTSTKPRLGGRCGCPRKQRLA